MSTESDAAPAAPAPSSRAAPRPVTRLAPTSGWVGPGLRQLWEYRELAGFLALRDIRVRYAQTALGAGWALLQPVATTLVFLLVFGRLAHLPSEGVPYAVFSLSGLVLWTATSTALNQASLSLVDNTALVSKVWFPRLCLPVAAVTAALVDLAVATVATYPVLLVLGTRPSLRLLLLPVPLLVAVAFAVGVGCALAAVCARYRDVRHALPFAVQLLLFASPVAYASTLLSHGWRVVAAVNPVVGAVETWRWALVGTRLDVAPLLGVSAASALVLLVGGVLLFRRGERSFADVV